MANFDRPAPWQQTVRNPASPEGLRQTATKGFAAEQEGLQPWFGTSYLGAAQDWYGGRNILGENNGWSNGFVSRSFDYVQATEQRAGAEKNPTVMWDMFDSSIKGNEQATGVATWDDDRGRWKRGDVFVDGKRDSNLYEDMDKATADTLLLDFMDFSADQKRRLFKESVPRTPNNPNGDYSAISRAVDQKSKDLSDTASKARGAYQFETEVNERQEDLGGATGALGSIAAGAGGGALTGSMFGPWGTVIGAVVGGVGGWLNQDQLSEQVARSMEISERAYAKYDPIRGTMQSAKEWAGAGMRVISPFSNVWQGSADALMEGGSVGDGRSEFYEVNADGSRKASALIQGGDIIATLADSVLQFGGAGKYAYMGLMGTSGGTGLAGNISTGATFNMRTGDFDSFENGTEWFAGIASPVIDVVQMGTARAVTQSALKGFRSADELGDAARATYTVESGGMRFTRDKVTGEVTDVRKWTLGALAPSESIWQVPVRWKARTTALKAGRTEVSPDDLFQAAQTVTAPQSKWRGALVNGLSEGYEEAWQGFLDPLSVGEQVNGTEVFVQALYGAAGGVGMSAGALMQRSGKNGPRAYENMSMVQVELEARLKHAWRTDEVLTDSEWAAYKADHGVTEQDLRKMAASDAEEARQIGGVIASITDQLTIDNTRTSVLGDAFARAVTQLRDSGLRNVNPNAEEQLSILAFENNEFVTSRGMEAVHRSNTAMMSSVQMQTVLRKRLVAARVHLDELTEMDDKVEVLARLTVMEEMYGRVAAAQKRLTATTNIDEAKDIIEDINRFLQEAYDGEVREKQVDANGNVTWALREEEEQAYWRKAATLVFGRHPLIDSGSFAGFMPQVSFAMTLDQAHAAIGIHQGFLKPMQADHDGDRTTTLNLVYLPDDKIADLRKGLQQFQPKAEGEGSKLTHGIDMPDGENVRMLVWNEELRKPTNTPEYQAVWSALTDVEWWVLDRFSSQQMQMTVTADGHIIYTQTGQKGKGPIPHDRLAKLTRQFREQFIAGDKDAVQTLRDALLNEAGAAAIGDMSTKEPVLLELQQQFMTRFQKAGRELARLRATSTTSTPTMDVQRPDDTTTQVAISRGRAATVSQTLGNMGSGDPTRDSQKLWFSDITRVLADVRDNGWTPESIQYMARLFRQQTQGDSRTEAEIFLDKDPVQGRVMAWLDGIVRDIDSSANPAFAGMPTHELRAVLAMMRVPSVKMIDGEAVADGESSISLVQYLLRKSIEVETDVLRNVPEDDPRWRKLSSLRSLTYDNGPHSYTPKTAAIEMMRFLPTEQVVGVGDADYLGSNTTLDQKIKELSGMHPVLRKDALHRLKRSPAYMTETHRGLGDPPYTMEQLLDDKGQLKVNAYTLMVDALETAVNKAPDVLSSRDEKMGKAFRKGLADLHNYIDNLRGELLKQPDVKKELSDKELLETLILHDPELADMIVALVPEASLSGTLHVEDTRVYTAPWLINVLLERDTKMAEKNYFVYKHLTEFNHQGASVDTDDLADDMSSEERRQKISETAGQVDFDKLKSRFQQTLFIAAEDPTGFLLGYMLQQMDSARSVEEVLDAVNKVPALLGDRAPLLAYLDDVAQFESSPQDLWTMGLTSTQLLESLTRWSSRVKQISDSAVTAWAQDAADAILLQDAAKLLEEGVETRDARQTVALIRQTRENRKRRPDSVGPTARTEFMRVMVDPFVPMQDKGAAPEVARFIESVLTSFSFGVRQGWEQAVDAATAYQWKDIATNVTLLLDGPAQVMMPDGRTLMIDLSDDLTVIKMMQDPMTRSFIKAVMFDTVRDVDKRNSLQHYSMTATNGSIGQLLQEQNNIDLLTMTDRNPRDRQLKAHRGMGLIESALIKQAMTGKVADQGAALLPITRSIGETLVAYTSRADFQGVDMERMQRNVLEETWGLLVGMASKSREEREYLKRSVSKTMRERFGGNNIMAEMQQLFDASPMLKAQFEALLLDMADKLSEKSYVLADEARGYESQMRALPAATQRTVDEARRYTALEKLAKQTREEADRLLEQANAVTNGQLHLVDDSLFSADVAKAKYQMLDVNEPGIDQTEIDRRTRANEETRLNIRHLLELGNNKEAFRGKGTDLALLEKLARVDNTNLDDLNDPRVFTEKDWEQLGLWAATIHFTQLTERSADQALRSMGKPETDRLYDRTRMHLLDIFFDDNILDEVRALINPSLAAMPQVSIEELEATMTGKLLSKERLGQWTSAEVTESLKVREMITRGPVALAVAAAGSHAKRQRGPFGTATASTTAPDPVAHMADVTFDLDNPDPEVMRRISNGFFTEMTLVNHTKQQTRAVTGMVGVPSAREGMDDKYLILRRNNFDGAMSRLRSMGFIQPGERIEVTVKFVDPDTKPFTPEYINSVYFDKAGRNEEFMPLGDVISQSIFSTGGWSKDSQQRVFDVAARGGSAGFPTPLIPQDQLDKLIFRPDQAGDYLRRLAELITSKQYNDMEQMLDIDQAAVIKLLKQRMVVVGTVNGEQETHWIDEVISGAVQFEVGTAKLVQLSEEVASTLLSKQAMMGKPGVVSSVLVNPRDMNVMPSLDREELEDMDLTGIGETIEWDDPNSPLRGFAPLRTASMSRNRGDAYMRTYRQRMERWQAQASRVHQEVPAADQQAWRDLNKERMDKLKTSLGQELLLQSFTKMGIPEASFNTADTATNLLIRSQLDKFFGPDMSGRRIFEYTTQVGDKNVGLLSWAEIENDFAQAGKRTPVYGDFVTLNLDQFVTGPMTEADYDRAAERVKEVMEAFGERGIRIFLESTTTSYQVKERIATWMQSDPMGYESVHDSTSVYVPVLEFGSEGRTARALRRSLTEIDVFNPRFVAGRLVSDELFPLMGANENTVLVDTEYDGSAPWQRMAQLLIPGDLTIADEKGAISLNYPTPQQMVLLQKMLLPLVENDATWAEMLGQTNSDGDPKKADPKNVQTYKQEQFAGDHQMLTPGILDAEAARQRLISMLKRGVMPGVGDEVLPGQYLPTLNVSRDGTYSVVLTRVGFKLPKEDGIRRHWSKKIDPDNPMRVSMATSKMNDVQSVPPPMMITEDPFNTANGLLVVGEFEHHKWGKWIDAALGFKAGRIKLSGLRFRGAMAANGFRPSEAGSLTSESGKQTTGRLVNNYRDMFTVTGFDIRNLMVDAFVGKQADQAAYDSEWFKLKVMLDRWARRDFGYTEDQLARMMTTDGLATGWQEFSSFMTSAGLTAPPNPLRQDFMDDPTTRIATLAMMTLMAPRMRVEHVVSTPGMMTVKERDSENLQIVSLPPLFTKALQTTTTPETTKYLFAMANANMPDDPTGGKTYWFDTNFKFHAKMESGETGDVIDVVSWFQLVKPSPATEDLNAYADANTKSRKDESLHIAGVINAALDGTTTLQRDFEEKFRAATDGDKIIRFGDSVGAGEKGNLWKMLTRIKPREDQGTRLVPLQWKYVVDSIEDVRGYNIAFNKKGWAADIDRVRAVQAELLTTLGLTKHLENERVEVDYLVRQFYGSPGARDGQKDFVEVVSAEDYIEAVRRMTKFAKDGRNPLEAAKVPFPHEALWRKIHEAGVWKPRLGSGKGGRVADTWEETVYALFGQIEQSKQTVDSRFRRPMDGFMRTYTGTLPSLSSVVVSTDDQLNQRLLDPEVNRHFISMDPGVSSLLENPVILAEMEKTITNMMGLTQDVDPNELASMDSSALIAHRERVDRWAKRQDMTPQVKTSYLEYLESGTEYIGKAGSTNALMTGLVNLSLMNRLLNPPLYVSAIAEVWSRTALESFTDLILGDQIRGGGIVANKLADKLQSATGDRVRWQPRYDETEIQSLRSLARQMAGNTDFMEYLYKELMYTHLVTPGRGAVGNFLEKGATKVARAFSDPRWGMPAQSVTELYIGAVLEHMLSNGAIFTIESFVQQMEQDPLFLVKNSREEGGFTAHKAGLNRVAQIRSMKPTTLGKAFTGPIDTLTHGNAGYNFLGHALKIPFQFAGFTSNALITMMGLGGADQIIAMYLDGRDQPGFLNKMDAHIRGQKPQDKQWDMSDVLEAVDLSRAFIRGGVTQTGLFAAALFASNLGLGGEDDEMRKRRKLAEYLNTPLFLDPREMQNDFLYADAIFVDQIPILGTLFKDTDMPEGEERSVIVPHWIIRQFTSPMMGTLRFLQTGDAMDIYRGFSDAFSVMPNSIMRLWDEASETATLLFAQANEEDYEGNTAEAQAGITSLLINAVSMYEKALIENSFINGLRNGADEYNRNPWLMPATDETGNIAMREGRNDMPLRSEALESFRDPVTGETREAYDTRSGMSGRAHAYAENNLTFGLLASLFTGQIGSDSTYLRNNMVVGETKIQLPEVDRARIEATLLSAYEGMGGQQVLTFDEAVRKVKKKYEDANVRWNQSDVEEEAQKIVDSIDKEGHIGGMSVISPEGAELITQEGAAGVYHSLRKGAIDFSDGSLAGLWIDMDTRKAIEAEWAEDLIQEGVDLGLNQQTAEYRMKRIMRGDYTDPERPGLRAILYSDKIPYYGDVRYNQLNMTFMIGPDGKPWATPFKRQSPLAALGIPVPQTVQEAPAGMRKDSRGKLVDEVYGINLGVHGLERQLEEPPEMPDESALDAAAAKTYTPQQSGSYGAFKRWPRRSYGGGGGYGGSSYGPRFERMQFLPQSRISLRPDDIPFINTLNPQIRRARIHRERITSERGRLKQWQ